MQFKESQQLLNSNKSHQELEVQSTQREDESTKEGPAQQGEIKETEQAKNMKANIKPHEASDTDGQEEKLKTAKKLKKKRKKEEKLHQLNDKENEAEKLEVQSTQREDEATKEEGPVQEGKVKESQIPQNTEENVKPNEASDTDGQEEKLKTAKKFKKKGKKKKKIQQQNDEENEAEMIKIGQSLKLETGTYKVISKIGQGSYGIVYRIQDEEGKFYAMKIATGDGIKELYADGRILKLAEGIESPHFCKFKEAGYIKDSFAYIIMTLAGAELGDIVKTCNLTTKIILCQQSLRAIQDLHKLHQIHCDIKDSNLCIGVEKESNIVKIMDFGLTTTIREEGNRAEKGPEEVPYFYGTQMFCPIAALKRLRQSRKDDLESWFYMIICWMGVALPWADEDFDNLEMKENFWKNVDETVDLLMPKCPYSFKMIFLYLKELQYGDIPDYQFLQTCLDLDLKDEHRKSKTSKILLWNSSSEYAPPPLSLDVEPNPRWRLPYYIESNQRHHFNVILRGESYNKYSFRQSFMGRKNVDVFKCRLDQKCRRLLFVEGYDRKKIVNDDEACIIGIANKHKCYLKAAHEKYFDNMPKTDAEESEETEEEDLRDPETNYQSLNT